MTDKTSPVYFDKTPPVNFDFAIFFSFFYLLFCSAFELSPHVFSIAEDAYRSLLTSKTNQSIVITGESGSGKTEASKQIMSYIATVSDEENMHKKSKKTRGIGGKTTFGAKQQVSISSVHENHVKTQILESNPLLESFGNAKTIRNNNSSRFGKYMEILFSHSGEILGGRVMQFLLEKSRVIAPASDERNFHIFYQIFTDASVRDKLKLTKPADYVLLTRGKCLTVRDVDDAADFRGTRRAMDAAGISAEEQMEVFRVLSGILNLGNIEYTDNAGRADIRDRKYLQIAAEMLGIDVEALKKNLLSKTVEAGGRSSTYNSPLDKHEAENARDALAKAIYGKLFSWIVERVNASMARSSEEILQQEHNRHYRIGTNSDSGGIEPLVIGILDIYGFEIFDSNSFEQLLINYCNENLHQLFIDRTLKEEQEEYEREGIEWKPVEYENNLPCVELIDKQPMGIFSLLNETCLIKGTDAEFVQKVRSNLSTHKYMIMNEKKELLQGKENTFTVKHYAGEVTYESSGFVAKNLDQLFPNFVTLMFGSKSQLVLNLFSINENEDTLQSSSSSRRPMQKKFGMARGNVANKRPAPIATQFKKQVDTLMSKLYSCRPLYIRCIKPNEAKAPNVLDAARVRDQVRYLGLMENVIVRKAGFIWRENFELFNWVYRVVTPETYPRFNGSDREACDHILRYVTKKGGAAPPSSSKSDRPYQLGKTKVFIKHPEMLFTLEELRDRKLFELASIIQRNYRAYRARKHLIELKNKSVSMLERHKARRRVSAYRMFLGDHFELQGNTSFHTIQQKQGDQSMAIFSSVVNKITRSAKKQSRVMCITDNHVYELSLPSKKKRFKNKKVMSIKDIKKISLSPMPDNFFVLHFGKPNDFLFESDDKV